MLDGQLTIGELVTFNFYVQLLVWPLRTIGMTIAFGQRAAAALERIDEIVYSVMATRNISAMTRIAPPCFRFSEYLWCLITRNPSCSWRECSESKRLSRTRGGERSLLA